MTAPLATLNYDFSGRTAVVTGGGGVLCREMCLALARCGAQVAVLDIDPAAAGATAAAIQAEGGTSVALGCNVLDKDAVEQAASTVMAAWGRVDILINGAGGNRAEATTNPERRLFDLPIAALQQVFDLNSMGTIIPSLVFGRYMAAAGEGVILNISSMNAVRPLTRIPAYSAGKAAVANFTQWLAVHLAQEYSPRLRVNALAPGFFVTEQTRYLHIDANTGGYTARGEAILAHTPMQRFGTPADLIGAVLFLVSPAAAFITGVVLPVDGGFSAFSGV
jgi:NAD(P)-dependent dehydrogenase (short-subunit alcohol dehydrogenase family)